MSKLTKRFLAPIAALGLAASLGGCWDMKINVEGDGVPLAELDTSGASPTGIGLAGPDNVIVTTGDAFAITVEGDSEITDLLRFDLDGGSLNVYRESDNWDGDKTATVSVTLTSIEALKIAGSGTIEADSLTGDAEVKIAGSGTARATNVAADSLEVDFGGSGRFEGAGTAESLRFNSAGSGTADMAGLKVGSANVKIAGSGNAVFASDGEVDAKIVGSGDVRVTGDAKCSVNTVGSGSLTCEKATAEAAAE